MSSAHAQPEDRNQEQPKAEAAQGTARPANDNQGFFAWAERVVSDTAQSIREDRTIPAIGREAVKDVRNTFHEFFFGRPEGHSEAGTPLNPLPSEIADGTVHGGTVHGATVADDQQHDPLPYGFSQSGVNYSMPSPSDIAYDRHKIDNPQNARNQPNGQVLTQEEKGWRERMEERRPQSTGNSDGYDRQKERIKPEEDRQERKEQERGGRCR